MRSISPDIRLTAAFSFALITPMCVQAAGELNPGLGIPNIPSSSDMSPTSSSRGTTSDSDTRSGDSLSPTTPSTGLGTSPSNSLNTSANSVPGSTLNAQSGTVGVGAAGSSIVGNQPMANIPTYSQSTGASSTIMGTPPSGSSTFNGSPVRPFSASHSGTLTPDSTTQGPAGQEAGISAECAAGVNCEPTGSSALR